MKAPWTDPALRELLALAALSAFGCGLALAHADLLFAAIFAAAAVDAVRNGASRKEGLPSAQRVIDGGIGTAEQVVEEAVPVGKAADVGTDVVDQPFRGVIA